MQHRPSVKCTLFFLHSYCLPLTPSVKPVPFSVSHTSFEVWLLVKPKAQSVARPTRAAAGPALPQLLAQAGLHRAQAAGSGGAGAAPQAADRSSGSSAPWRPLTPPRPWSVLCPPRPTQTRLRQTTVSYTGRTADAPRPRQSPTEAEARAVPASGASRSFPAPPPQPRVLTGLQSAEQPGRGPGNAAPLLENIAQDGAHTAAAAAAAATLPLQASPSAPQGAGQLVLSHPGAPGAPVQPPSAWVTLCAAGVAASAVVVQRVRSVEGPLGAARVWLALRGRGDLWGTTGAAERSVAGGHLQCGACTAQAGERLGRGGGRERVSSGRGRRSRPQSRHHRVQAGLLSPPRTRAKQVPGTCSREPRSWRVGKPGSGWVSNCAGDQKSQQRICGLLTTSGGIGGRAKRSKSQM